MTTPNEAGKMSYGDDTEVYEVEFAGDFGLIIFERDMTAAYPYVAHMVSQVCVASNPLDLHDIVLEAVEGIAANLRVSSDHEESVALALRMTVAVLVMWAENLSLGGLLAEVIDEASGPAALAFLALVVEHEVEHLHRAASTIWGIVDWSEEEAVKAILSIVFVLLAGLEIHTQATGMSMLQALVVTDPANEGD